MGCLLTNVCRPVCLVVCSSVRDYALAFCIANRLMNIHLRCLYVYLMLVLQNICSYMCILYAFFCFLSSLRFEFRSLLYSSSNCSVLVGYYACANTFHLHKNEIIIQNFLLIFNTYID